MKKTLVGLIVAVVFALWLFDGFSLLTLDNLKLQQAALQSWTSESPWQASAIYFGIYTLVTALSIPGAVIMTLAGGALFGLLWGFVLISFASTLGATLAMLASRYLIRDWVCQRFSSMTQKVDQGIEREGKFYLFSLRLIPVVPFFVINLAMGLTKMRVREFWWVSQVGMLAGTLVYVNAGTELAKIESLSGILSPGLLGAFVLLGIFPFIARKGLEIYKTRKLYSKWSKPESFDRNVIVIGAGSGGLVSAYIAAAVKADVTLIEKHKMGGDCLNTGCVPSKALIRSAKQVHQILRSDEFGVKASVENINFKQVMERVHRTIEKIEPHDSIERYTGLGVDVIEGEARMLSPWEVEIQTESGSQTLTARSIIIATGARPRVPEIEGLEENDYLTSDTLWGVDSLPQKLVVVGGGPIGCELAQAFSRLGSQVTVVQRSSHLLPREDEDVQSVIESGFEHEGIGLQLSSDVIRVHRDGDQTSLVVQKGDETISLEFDKILIAVGRQANIENIGLETLGIELNATGNIESGPFLQTQYPNIYVCGDVAGPYQFTHVAAHQAWYASVNALFSSVKRFKVDYRVIPWATFVDPEVARVGLNEKEANEQGIPFEVTRYGIDDLDRAIADGEDRGFVKVLTTPGKDKIIGVTLVGHHSADLIAEFVLAMKHGLGLNKVLGTTHIYPTFAEANKFAAGEWKKAHVSPLVLKYLEKYHQWMKQR